MHSTGKPYTLLGFDFGMKRIGIAIANSITQTARPLLTLHVNDGIPDWNEIESLIKTWNTKVLIVGMPYSIDNQYQEITYAARKFKNRLKQKFKLSTHEIEEQYTTKIARMEKKPGDDIDSVAASIILQAWLDSKPNSH
jgi:putative holliday junction resolvase